MHFHLLFTSVAIFYPLLSLSGHGDSSSQKTAVLVQGIGPAESVASGSSHTVVLSKDGLTVWTFGAGDNGMLILWHSV